MKLARREYIGDANIRIGRIVDLGVLTTDMDSDQAEWLFESGSFPEVAVNQEAEPDEVAELFAEELVFLRLTGWLVEVEAPSLDRWPMFSWGSYQQHLIRAPSYDQAIDQAIEWGNQRMEAAGATPAPMVP
jgi:hypothetical protein